MDLVGGRVLQAGNLGVPAAAEDDVGTTPGHVGGDGHGAGATGLGDDLRFFLMVLGVQYLVGNPFPLQQVGDHLGGFDRGGTHQHRTATFHAALDVRDDGRELLVDGQVDQVVVVLADHRLVGGNHHHVQAVDLTEFEGLGIGGTCHAGQLVVQAEVVLEGGRSEERRVGLDLQPFLGFDGLVQAFGEPASGHGPTGVFV